MMLKDMLLFRSILTLAVIAIFAPFGSCLGRWMYLNHSVLVLLSELNSAAYIALLLIVPIAAVLGAAALGEETNLDTLRFLTFLPLSMARIVECKLCFTASCFMVLSLPSVVVLYGTNWYFDGALAGPFGWQPWYIVAYLLLEALTAFALAWFFTSVRVSSGAAGLMACTVLVAAYLAGLSVLESAGIAPSAIVIWLCQFVLVCVLIAAGAYMHGHPHDGHSP